MARSHKSGPQIIRPDGSAGYYLGVNAAGNLVIGAGEDVESLVALTIGPTGVLTAALDVNLASLDMGDGSVSAPSYSFQSDDDIGMYRSAANELSFATAGVQGMYLDAIQDLYIPNGELRVTRSDSGQTVSSISANTSNTASSSAQLRATVGGSSAGDPYVSLSVTGVQGWVFGIDNSASDAFVISAGDVLGTGNAISISTAGAVTVVGNIGLYGVTPVARASAYTQTYATASRTHSNPTAAALTVTDGAGTNDGTIGAITADASVISAVQELADQINKLVADVTNVKQVLNSTIDDSQAIGISQ